MFEAEKLESNEAPLEPQNGEAGENARISVMLVMPFNEFPVVMVLNCAYSSICAIK